MHEEVDAGPSPRTRPRPLPAERSWQRYRTSVPALPARFASRRALIDRIRSGEPRLVLVDAPAGSGKTCLLAEWAAIERRPVVWVSLDAADGERSLVDVVVREIERVVPGAAEAPRPVDGPAGAASREVADGLGPASAPAAETTRDVARRLAARLAEQDAGLVLFVDRADAIASPAERETLERLADTITAGTTVVLAGRERLDDPSADAGAHPARRVRASDLRLGAGEATGLLALLGVDASAEAVARIVDRCEGWIAGLRLCAQAIADGADADTITGRERFVAEYLREQCLDGLPEATRVFLRRVSVLDELTGDLCDAVVGRPGSALLLDELATRPLLLEPVGDGGSFRLHPLMRDCLAGELEHAEPQLSGALRRAAAAWFIGQGRDDEAVDHLLGAGAHARAAALLAPSAHREYRSGDATRLGDRLRRIPPSTLARFPELVAIAAWIALENGEIERAAVLRRELDERFEGAETETGADEAARERIGLRAMLDASLEAAHASFRAPLDASQAVSALDHARLAVRVLPAASVWRPYAECVLGAVLRALGDEDEATAWLERAVADAEAIGDVRSLMRARSRLAFTAVRRGRWAVAEAHAREIARHVESSGLADDPVAVIAFALEARVRAHRHERKRALAALDRADRLLRRGGGGLSLTSIEVRLQTAFARLDLGDRERAAVELAAIDATLRRTSAREELVQEIELLRARLAAPGGESPLTPAERRVLGLLPSQRTLAQIADELGVSRNTVSSQVRSIYRKLDASTRSAAVERARHDGILER